MTGHEPLESRLRAAHAVSLERLSPTVQAQLTQRRRRALTAERHDHARPALRWAMATLAVAVVALGVFRPTHRPDAPTLAASTSTAAPADLTDDNPDFYLWLASNDATSLASE